MAPGKSEKRSINCVLTPKPKSYLKKLKASSSKTINVVYINPTTPKGKTKKNLKKEGARSCEKSRSRSRSSSSSSSETSFVSSKSTTSTSSSKTIIPRHQNNRRGVSFSESSENEDVDLLSPPDSPMSINQAINTKPIVLRPSVINLNANQDIQPKDTDKATGKETDTVVLEVFKVNGIPFDGVLSHWDIIDIWKCLGRSENEILRKATEQIRKSCLRIKYVLKNPIQLTELSRKPEFEFDKKGSFRTDVYRVRLADYEKLAYTIGETVTITIQKTFFVVTTQEMIDWVSPFGEVIGEPR